MELEPGADRDAVADWLNERGLATFPLAVGLLATGTADAVRDAFGVEPAASLPVPGDMVGHVASISVAPPKQIY